MKNKKAVDLESSMEQAWEDTPTAKGQTFKGQWGSRGDLDFSVIGECPWGSTEEQSRCVIFKECLDLAVQKSFITLRGNP